jgi:hypothetical protein
MPPSASSVTCTGFWALDPLDAAAERGGKSTSRGVGLVHGLASASCPSSSSGLKEQERSVRGAIDRARALGEFAHPMHHVN